MVVTPLYFTESLSNFSVVTFMTASDLRQMLIMINTSPPDFETDKLTAVMKYAEDQILKQFETQFGIDLPSAIETARRLSTFRCSACEREFEIKWNLFIL